MSRLPRLSMCSSRASTSPKWKPNFTCCVKKALPLAKALVEYVEADGCADTFKGSIDFNPFREPLRKGVAFDPSQLTAMACEILDAVKNVKGLRVLSVNSDMLSNAGAYIFQELGYALAWGAQWMTLLTDAGPAARAKWQSALSSTWASRQTSSWSSPSSAQPVCSGLRS